MIYFLHIRYKATELIEAKWCIYVSVNYVTIASDNGLWPVRRQAIIWKKCWVIINGAIGDIFQWKFNPNTTFFFQEYALNCRLENGCHLSRPQCDHICFHQSTRRKDVWRYGSIKQICGSLFCWVLAMTLCPISSCHLLCGLNYSGKSRSTYKIRGTMVAILTDRKSVFW